MTRVLVCGGRGYNDTLGLFARLDALHAELGVTAVIHGGAMGADFLADCWAELWDIPREVYPAAWAVYGKGAGAERNARMLRESKPDLVMVFPGGRGTADMVRRARAAGVPVLT